MHSKKLENFKNRILKKLDSMGSDGHAKLGYLNGLFLKVKTFEQEKIILKMIQELKQWGY